MKTMMDVVDDDDMNKVTTSQSDEDVNDNNENTNHNNNENSDDYDDSFKTTPEDITYEKQLQQLERETGEEKLNDIIPSFCEKKEKEQVVEQYNQGREYDCELTTWRKAGSWGEEAIKTNTNTKTRTGKHNNEQSSDNSFKHSELSGSSFQLTPERIADERQKQFEQESKVSIPVAATASLPRQQTQSTTIVQARYAKNMDSHNGDGQTINSQQQQQPLPILDNSRQSSCETRGTENSHLPSVPGAFAVGPIDMIDDDDDVDDEHDDDNSIHSKSSSSSCVAITAEAVDEEGLAQQCRSWAETEIRKRMRKEVVTAIRLSLSSKDDNSNNNTRPYMNMTLIFIMLLGLVLSISLSLSLPGKKQKLDGTATVPSSSPSSPPSLSDFNILQNIFFSLSNNTVYNPSSAQYKALEWLLYEDSYVTNITNTELSSLVPRYALAVLYFSTNGSNWLDSTEYLLTNRSVCEWQFITCNSLESVVEIKIEHNKLNGSIPSELAVISSLELISFKGNNLSSTIPSIFGSLSRLVRFDGSLNMLSGSIPNSFSQLTKLNRLEVDENELTGILPPGLINIPNLEVVDVRWNLLSGPIPNFAQNELQFIDLIDNLLTGPIPESMMNLSNLEYFDMANNTLSGTIPNGIGGMKKISSLYMEGNLFRGTIPTTMGELEYIKHFWFSGNKINGTLPTEFGKFINLVSTEMNDNQLTGTIPTELGQLNKLNWFSIVGNPITGTVPISFSQLTNLEHMHLTNTSISGSLDSVFCTSPNSNMIKDLDADCFGSFPEVDCSCCTKCCQDGTDHCEVNVSQICQTYIYEFESISNATDCTCGDDHLSLSCNNSGCQTCNEDMTVCGTSTELTYSNWGSEHGYVTLTNTFKYEKGRNETITWQENRNDVHFWCNVTVNGESCAGCTRYLCDDDYRGISIDCSNVLNEDIGLYDSCNANTKGGVFDVFSWMEDHSWNGCEFVYKGPLQVW